MSLNTAEYLKFKKDF